tara:strand:+ start:398 stop:1069 length:672 start_codon:yes stop_codon:yes gene_type:complete
MLGQIQTYNSVKDQNIALNRENSRLRTELHRLKKYVPIKRRSSIIKELDTSVWFSRAAEIVRTSTHTSKNLLIANKGFLDGVIRGSGMLDKGHLAGKVIEVTDHEALVFPVTHKNIEWSVRIGEEGAVGRLVWGGGDLTTANVIDIAKSSLVLPGDKVYTTGFQGVFPSDILVGKVVKVAVTEADDFKTVIVKLGVDYSSIRFVEFLTDKRILKSDSLINSVR